MQGKIIGKLIAKKFCVEHSPVVSGKLIYLYIDRIIIVQKYDVTCSSPVFFHNLKRAIFYKLYWHFRLNH